MGFPFNGVAGISGPRIQLRSLWRARPRAARIRRQYVTGMLISMPVSARLPTPRRLSLPSSSTAIRFSSTKCHSTPDTLTPKVRHLMRSVPHPVAIVTSTSTYTNPSTTLTTHSPGSSSSHLDFFKGATVSSFNTVTLLPHPIVSFNITRQSSTFSAIQLSGLFNVHLLAPNLSEAQQIATKFASGNEGRPFHDDAGELEDWVDLKGASGRGSSGGKTTVFVSQEPRQPPVIRGRSPTTGQELVPFRLLCSHMTEKTVFLGDHVVVFGKVIDAADNVKTEIDKEGNETARDSTLAYVHGRYARAL